jgi:hypothetical protein
MSEDDVANVTRVVPHCSYRPDGGQLHGEVRSQQHQKEFSDARSWIEYVARTETRVDQDEAVLQLDQETMATQ